jgi:predicted transcriptional regulator
MTDIEKKIMRYFRQYRIGAHEMLFFNGILANASSTRFQSAMDSLIRNGLVIKERRKGAYSLTNDGFVASQSA